jgi:hypothetical protein
MKAKLSKICYSKPKFKATAHKDPIEPGDELAIFKFDEELALEEQQRKLRAPIETVFHRPTPSGRYHSPGFRQ